MSKNIIIKSSMCANVKDVACYLDVEFGLFPISFSEEFSYVTGYTEHEAQREFGENEFNEMRLDVIKSLKENLTRPSVIVFLATSLTDDELSPLGYCHCLEMNTLPAGEMAEYIFEKASEYYCGKEKLPALVA